MRGENTWRQMLIATIFSVAGVICSPVFPAIQQAFAQQKSQDNEDQGVRDLGRNVVKLHDDAAATLDRLLKQEGTLADTAKSMDQAGKLTDDTLADLQKYADRLDPKAAVPKLLESREDFLRQMAKEALSSPNPADHQFGDQLSDAASHIGGLRKDFQDLRTQYLNAIDRLQRLKPQLKYAVVLHQAKVFEDMAREYFNNMKVILNQTKEVTDQAITIIGPNAATQ